MDWKGSMDVKCSTWNHRRQKQIFIFKSEDTQIIPMMMPKTYQYLTSHIIISLLYLQTLMLK